MSPLPGTHTHTHTHTHTAYISRVSSSKRLASTMASSSWVSCPWWGCVCACPCLQVGTCKRLASTTASSSWVSCPWWGCVCVHVPVCKLVRASVSPAPWQAAAEWAVHGEGVCVHVPVCKSVRASVSPAPQQAAAEWAVHGEGVCECMSLFASLYEYVYVQASRQHLSKQQLS